MVVGAIKTASSKREKETEHSYTPESLHTLGVLESILGASQSPAPRKFCTRAVVLSWIVLCLQLLMVSYLLSGYVSAGAGDFDTIWSSWLDDCSAVDRCDYLDSDSPTVKHVCMARVTLLNMSSATKEGCARCPAFDTFREALDGKDPCDMASFSKVDSLAGLYFDLWATLPAGVSTYMDLNGPFERTCGQARNTSDHGWAGKKLSCTDCFGDDFSETFHADPM